MNLILMIKVIYIIHDKDIYDFHEETLILAIHERIILKEVTFHSWEEMEACNFTITYP
jgi:hypothetical protein